MGQRVTLVIRLEVLLLQERQEVLGYSVGLRKQGCSRLCQDLIPRKVRHGFGDVGISDSRFGGRHIINSHVIFPNRIAQTVLLWQVLLYRLSGRAKFIIGKSYDGRPYEELEAAIGLFEKYLPLQCHFEEDTQFNEILQQVNQLTDEAYEYQEYFNPEEFVEGTENTSNSAFLPFCFDFVEQGGNRL